MTWAKYAKELINNKVKNPKYCPATTCIAFKSGWEKKAANKKRSSRLVAMNANADIKMMVGSMEISPSE
jgi:hypothetical protein